MLEAAERLFAERGLDAVSLRDVAVAAGQRNNSAVQYHFGSREGLLRAVFVNRMRPINEGRHRLLAAADARGAGQDVRTLVECYLLPLTDFLGSAPQHYFYARFLAEIAPIVDFTEPELKPVIESLDDIVARLVRSLSHLNRRTAVARVRMIFTMQLAALGAHEHRVSGGLWPVFTDFDDLVTELIDMGVGALQAPHTDRG